jgi:hypothetical protein
MIFLSLHKILLFMSCIQAISLTETKDVFSILQAIVTIAAMIIGGIWTYRKFIKQRLLYPRINLSMSIDFMSVSQTHNLIHVAILHENKGDTLLQSQHAELRLRQVLPLPSGIDSDLNTGKDPVLNPATYIEWPMMYNRYWDFQNESPFEIEPGENDSLHADFFIEKHIIGVQFYYYISNIKKQNKDLGWSLTTYYPIPEK